MKSSKRAFNGAVNNILLSGFCACPGTVRGKVRLWKGNGVDVEEGSILVLLPASKDPPVGIFRKCAAVVSCRHTTYSHVASIAMEMCMPCVVGAVISEIPDDGVSVVLNAWSCCLYIGEKDALIQEGLLEEREWKRKISLSVRDLMRSNDNKILLRTVDVDSLDSYRVYLSGMFADTMLFGWNQSSPRKLAKKIAASLEGMPLYYRFSSLPTAGNLHSAELLFAKELVKFSVVPKLFVANSSSYEDVFRFREAVEREIGLEAVGAVGTMVENATIIEDLGRIANDQLVDFFVIGINDLSSTCLGLDRDNRENQNCFKLGKSNLRDALHKTSKVALRAGIPCFVGFPKYHNFLEDLALLRGCGLESFFATRSLLELVRDADDGVFVHAERRFDDF